MTDALTKAADAAIAAGGDAVHLANLAARRTRLFRQTDSGKSVYNSLEEFST